MAVVGDDVYGRLLDLRDWLNEENALRGAVRLVEAPAPAERLGPAGDALQIVAASAGSAFVAVLVAWLRTRVGAVKVVVTGRNGAKIELDAKTVKALDAAALSDLTRELLTAAGDAEPEDPGA
ncbi:hypothetical protein BXY51_000156 [Actinoplanes cyaneus]|nr:hypothetical protein [Actinoplanes cyaneus]